MPYILLKNHVKKVSYSTELKNYILGESGLAKLWHPTTFYQVLKFIRRYNLIQTHIALLGQLLERE